MCGSVRIATGLFVEAVAIGLALLILAKDLRLSDERGRHKVESEFGARGGGKGAGEGQVLSSDERC